ncbi:MAG: hypothetical protein IJJ68_05975 [Prevotella sp.]|nr:hypothetical protein [Prevotella sp.]
MKENLLQRVYDATNGGLDIITELLPAVDDGVINLKKAFRLRPDERTPSAHLYPPKDAGDCWHVKDFGMGDGGGYFSPIDLYMWDRGYGQDKFSIALQELAERYGVQEQLTASANKPELEQRKAREDEVGAEPRVTLLEGFGGIDLSCWGANVKPEHLETYGWKAVGEIATTKGDKVTVRRSTPTYPIFAQQCDYTDANGQPQSFMKLYEPKNYDKTHRFMIVGRKPQRGNYIYGLQAVRKAFQERGEEKLSVLLLVSGGSDAAIALSSGYLAVWLDSETKGLSDADYALLMKYTKWLVNIPDIDATGKKMGRQLALKHLGMHTAWMNDADMGGLHDNRGRQRKDLRDYLQLHPSKKAMDTLVNRAVKAKFWSDNENKSRQKEYTISLTSLNYFLELNGFFTLKDESRKEPLFIRIEGAKVSRITAKAVVTFLSNWMASEGLPKALQDKVLRSHDLPTNNRSTLRERDDLDFSRATESSQRLYFRNTVVDVTADGIRSTPYSMLSDGKNVWADDIIDHDFRKMDPQFEVTKDDNGDYHIMINSAMPSKLFQFVHNTARLYWRKEDDQKQELTAEERRDEELNLLAKVSNLGYLIHGHKAESMAWATLCQDSTLGNTDDECNGRSGKSFYLKAVGVLINTFPIEARTPKVVENRFLFDGVTEDTDLIIVDECHRKLDYDFFFGKITGPFRAEEKGNHPYLIPFPKSPKFAFGTNYVLRRHDPSTEGRLWPQVFSDYYHVMAPTNDYKETRTIRDDFQQELMGADYSEADWQADIAFLIDCLRFYLSLPKNERKMLPPLNQVERREQRAAIGKDFELWAEDYFAIDGGNLDRPIKQSEVMANFNTEATYPLKPKRFTSKLKEYCSFANHISCLNPVSVTGNEKNGERWRKKEEGKNIPYYYVQSINDTASKPKPNEEEEDIPF